MEAEEFRELLRSLFEGTISKADYHKLFRYLAGIANKITSDRFSYEEISEITHDFIVKLLESKGKFTFLLDEPGSLQAYVVTSFKNFIFDHMRKAKYFEILDSDLVSDPRIIRVYELEELEEVFRKKIKPEKVKYFCYKLDSKRYKCLWRGRSENAIYKDVSRNKRVIEEFGDELRKLGVSEELLEEFIKVKLSKICEELRSELCEEEK